MSNAASPNINHSDSTLPIHVIQIAVISATIFTYQYATHFTLPASCKRFLLRRILLNFLGKIKFKLVNLNDGSVVSIDQFALITSRLACFSPHADNYISLDISPWNIQAIKPTINVRLVRYLAQFLPASFSFRYFTLSADQVFSGFKSFFDRLYDLTFSISSNCRLFPYNFNPRNCFAKLLRIPLNLANNYISIMIILQVHVCILFLLINRHPHKTFHFKLSRVPFIRTSGLGVGDVIFRAKYLEKYWPELLKSHISARPDLSFVISRYLSSIQGKDVI